MNRTEFEDEIYDAVCNSVMTAPPGLSGSVLEEAQLRGSYPIPLVVKNTAPPTSSSDIPIWLKCEVNYTSGTQITIGPYPDIRREGQVTISVFVPSNEGTYWANVVANTLIDLFTDYAAMPSDTEFIDTRSEHLGQIEGSDYHLTLVTGTFYLFEEGSA